jgi:hypothetical protein
MVPRPVTLPRWRYTILLRGNSWVHLRDIVRHAVGSHRDSDVSVSRRVFRLHITHPDVYELRMSCHKPLALLLP